MSFLDNELKLYFGDDFVINDHIRIRQPIINDIVEIGENEYFSTVHTLTAIPSDMKPELFDYFKIYWEEISDFELFIMFSRTLPVDRTRIFFGDLDFTKFDVRPNEYGDPVMIQPSANGDPVVIDNGIYLQIVEFLRTIHGIVPKIEHAATKTVRDILIDYDRKQHAKVKDDGGESQLVPLISSLINSSEFKYGLKEVREMPLYAFMDSVSRVQIIRSTTALLHGCYGGMIDSSKIDKKELNWMRSIKKDAA